MRPLIVVLLEVSGSQMSASIFEKTIEISVCRATDMVFRGDNLRCSKKAFDGNTDRRLSRNLINLTFAEGARGRRPRSLPAMPQ
jgi:hypothetical protein